MSPKNICAEILKTGEEKSKCVLAKVSRLIWELIYGSLIFCKQDNETHVGKESAKSRG